MKKKKRIPGFGPAGFWGPSKAMMFVAQPLLEHMESEEMLEEAFAIAQDLWNAFIPDGASLREATIAALRPRCEAICGDAIAFEDIVRRLRLRFYQANPELRTEADPLPDPGEILNEVLKDLPEKKDLAGYAIGSIDEDLLERVLPHKMVTEFFLELDRRMRKSGFGAPGHAETVHEKRMLLREIHRFVLEGCERYLRALPLRPEVIDCHIGNFHEYLEGYLDDALFLPITVSGGEQMEMFLLHHLFRYAVLTPVQENSMPFSLLFLYNFSSDIGICGDVNPLVERIAKITGEFSRRLDADRGIPPARGERRIKQKEAARIKGVSHAAVSQAVRLGTLNVDPESRRVICDEKFESWLTRRKNQYA